MESIIINVTEMDRNDYVIEDNESVVKIEGINAEFIGSYLKDVGIEKFDEIEDELYLIDSKDIEKVMKLNTAPKQKEQVITNPTKDMFESEAAWIFYKISPKDEDLKAIGLEYRDLNDTKDSSYDECLNYCKQCHKIMLDKYNKLSKHDRKIIDAVVMPQYMSVPNFTGIDDNGMTKLYDEAWNVVCKEDELNRYRKPDLVLHEYGIHLLGHNVLAAYSPADHTVTIGVDLWENYGEVELTDKEKQEIRDVFIHEFSHIVNFNHSQSFWELTGRNDTAGKQITAWKAAQASKLEKKIAASKHI